MVVKAVDQSASQERTILSMIGNLPIEHDENHTNARRKSKQALLREAILLDLPIFMGSHRVLLIFITSVKR